MSTFLKLDVFRKLPRDLTEPTTCGGIGKYQQNSNVELVSLVSIICVFALVFLSISEVRTYLTPST